MAEINFNNLYNQLSPMDKMFYDQQFQKKYNPNQENIILSSQPSYEQMKSAYDAQQQVPEKSFFDSLNPFTSASAAEMPQVPNLTYGNIDLPFDLRTGITNTKAASPFKIGLSDTLNQYNVPGLRSQDLINQLVEQNRQKVASDFINAPQDYYPSIPGGITAATPLQNLGIDTSYGVANEPDVEQVEYLGDRKPSGIARLFDVLRNLPTPMNLIRSIAENFGQGPTYSRFSPGGTFRGGIYSIDGVNIPTQLVNDFYNRTTGLNRFDRARQAFNKSRSLRDLFAASRTGAEFFDARNILNAQKKSGYTSNFMDRPKSERNYTGPSGRDNTGGDRGAEGAADSFSNRSGMGRTGY